VFIMDGFQLGLLVKLCVKENSLCVLWETFSKNEFHMHDLLLRIREAFHSYMFLVIK
jgi:hypothetical protein